MASSETKRLNINTLLLGEPLIIGLSSYNDMWEKIFVQLYSLNMGTSGER